MTTFISPKRANASTPVRPHSSYSTVSTIRKVTPSPDAEFPVSNQRFSTSFAPSPRPHSSTDLLRPFSLDLDDSDKDLAGAPAVPSNPHQQEEDQQQNHQLTLRRQRGRASPPKHHRNPHLQFQQAQAPSNQTKMKLLAPTPRPNMQSLRRSAHNDRPETPSPMTAEQHQSRYRDMGADGDDEKRPITRKPAGRGASATSEPGPEEVDGIQGGVPISPSRLASSPSTSSGIAPGPSRKGHSNHHRARTTLSITVPKPSSLLMERESWESDGNDGPYARAGDMAELERQRKVSVPDRHASRSAWMEPLTERSPSKGDGKTQGRGWGEGSGLRKVLNEDNVETRDSRKADEREKCGCAGWCVVM